MRAAWQGVAFVQAAPPFGRYEANSISRGDGMMRAVKTIALGAALLLAGVQAMAADPPLDELKWLAGAWVTEERGPAAVWTEERWAPPRGGVMLGTSLTGRGDKASGHE